MKILVVSGAFYPNASPRSFRTTELVKELYRQGHTVTLFAPEYRFDYTDFLKEYPINLRFVRIGAKRFEMNGNGRIATLFNRMSRRFTSTFLEYPDIKFRYLLPKRLSGLEGYDLLISIAIPHPVHWGVEKALKKNHLLAKTWVADCGDPFMLCKTDTFRKPFYFKPFELAFCRRADYITVPIEEAETGYYPQFRHKLRVIPQGFDFNAVKRVERYVPNDPITFYYAGAFIPDRRDPRPILDFLEESNVDFRFIVHTKQETLLAGYRARLKDKLIVRPYIDRLELLYRMSQADFLLNLENGLQEQSPSKLIDYALTGRPILSLDSQNLDREKFRAFLNRDYSKAYVIPDMERYDIRNVVAGFLALAK